MTNDSYTRPRGVFVVRAGLQLSGHGGLTLLVA